MNNNLLLKHLEIQGFKSFPDKTRVTFDRGLTAVVGPNGSGKSNISDAVRWVMGEQSTKTLRGDKMEDVIFSGTKNRKSQGFAEVSLTMDNSGRELPIDSDEITITRKYYRSGESEYMINRSGVRLKDINEMFMDTGLGKDGYSMVGQGKIAEIVRSKSNERREIFEEAAGISKFRYRKNEAERNLTHAEENLVRLRDILAELEGRIEPLKEQAAKAKAFLELSDEKKVLEVSIWNDTIDRSNRALKDQSDKIVSSNQRREALEREIEQTEAKVQAAFTDMQSCLVEMEDKRRERGELDDTISELGAQIAVCRNDILHNCQNVDRIDGEMERYQTSTQDILNMIAAKHEAISTINEEVKSIEQSIMDKQETLSLKTGENQSASARQQELSRKLNALILNESQLKLAITQLNANVADLTSSIERNTVEHMARLDELAAYRIEDEQSTEAMSIIAERLDGLANACSGHKLKLDNRRQQRDQVKQECEKSDLAIKELTQKAKLLEGLERSMEGFAYSVKEVLKRAGNGALRGILGTVSQVIEVSGEYSTAIEIALGSAMQNIIVENEGDAKSAIRMLQQNNLGRATFLPLTSISGNVMDDSGLDRYAGYINVASRLVQYETRFKPIIDSLLGRTLIVDDIDTAVMIAQKNGYRFRIVTLDGQVVNAGGSLTGGSKNKNQGFLSRKNDIAELHQSIERLTKKHSENIARLTAIQDDVSRINAEFNAVNSEILTINEDKIRLESEQKRIRSMMTQIQSLTANMEQELESKRQRLTDRTAELDDKSAELAIAQSGVNGSTLQLSEFESSYNEAVQAQQSMADELNELRITAIERAKDGDSCRQAIDELQRQHEDKNRQTVNLQEQRNVLLAENASIEERINAIDIKMEQSRALIGGIDESIASVMVRRNQYEEESTHLRRVERDLSEQKEQMSSETVRLEERHAALQREYDEIIAKLWDEYELTRSEAQTISQPIESVSKANAQLNSIKGKIRALGSVNVAAIEEYKEVSERYAFLNEQVKDANRSRNELLKLISDLTQKMQEIFLENFNLINNHFKEIFVELFGGGRANLTLTEPDNVLESGIEIFVEPPGKIIKNLASLSGGEQSFIAIAIYFAILKVRPAPFCILDEIEAALDDVNVVKYAHYLRKMCDKTQFIMITHRRGSMEAADVLYGVTMQEEGISKLLQLKASELEQSNIT